MGDHGVDSRVSCVSGNETTDLIKRGGFLDYLRKF